MKKTIKTTWELWIYDVWGNRQDGYSVNDRTCINRNLEINLKLTTFNQGLESEFKQAIISDYQLGQIFDTRSKLDVDGEDTIYYVNRESDGYPLGELNCTSHESLFFGTHFSFTE